jgi:hypothetical protein
MKKAAIWTVIIMITGLLFGPYTSAQLEYDYRGGGGKEDGGFTCVKPRPRKFLLPRVGVYRLDRCLYWSSSCGAPAAHEWCRLMHYNKATDWVVDENIGAHSSTLVLYGDATCEDSFCDGFASITCSCD